MGYGEGSESVGKRVRFGRANGAGGPAGGVGRSAGIWGWGDWNSSVRVGGSNKSTAPGLE